VICGGSLPIHWSYLNYSFRVDAHAVPILPLYLHELNLIHDVERTRTTLPPVSGDVTRQHQGDDVTPRQFALASDSFYEWVDGSSRQADRQWLLERLLWLRHNWTESASNAADNASLGEDYEDLLSAGGDSPAAEEIIDFQQVDGKLGILLAAKAIAQIVSNPIVGLIINRFVSLCISRPLYSSLSANLLGIINTIWRYRWWSHSNQSFIYLFWGRYGARLVSDSVYRAWALLILPPIVAG